jgi:hypothetical protein
MRRTIPENRCLMPGVTLSFLLFAAWAGASAGPASAEATPLRAGFARRVITPALDRPVYLAGFDHDRRATGVHDDLYARCLAVADRRLTLALCSLDVIGFFLPDTEKARALFAAKAPGARLVVASTHDHQGPDTLGLWGPSTMTSGVDPAYMEALRRAVADTAAEAVAALAPARVVFASGRTPGLIADGREPKVIDETIVAARFTGEDGSPLGTLVDWSSHPEALGRHNTLITADYPYALVRAMEADPGGTCVFFSGSIGGLMSPLSVEVKDAAGRPVPPHTFEHAEQIGTRAAAAAREALRAAPPPSPRGADVALEYRWRRVRVPLSNALFRIAFALGLLNRPLFTKDALDTGTKLVVHDGVPLPLPAGEDLETEIGYVRLADAEILLVPGEIYPELVFGGIQDPQDPGADFPGAPREPPLMDLLHVRHRMVIGLANDELGYVIPRSEWDEKPPFAYGRKEAQYGEVNSVGDRVAPTLVEAFRSLLAASPTAR